MHRWNHSALSHKGKGKHMGAKKTGGENRVQVLLVAFLTLIFIAIIANLVFTLSQARQRVLEGQYVTLEKLVQVLEQQTVDSFNAVEIALQASSRAIQLLPPQAPGRDEAVQDILVSSIHNLPFVRAIWVLDPAGNMIHDSERLPGKYNLADREYFKVHRDKTVQGLYIDRPMLSKHGVWFIGVSLRMTNPDGSFAGVIAAAFEPKHFRRFYESIKLGNEGIVSLVGADGTLMLRVPEVAGAEGKRLHPLPGFIKMLSQSNTGKYRAASSVDKTERIYFYRSIGKRPLVVVVGVGEREVLEPWRNTAKAYTAVSIAFLALVAWLGHLGITELRRRTALHQALTESESALTSAQRIARLGSWELDFSSKQGRWSDEMFALLRMEKTSQAPPLSDFLATLHPEDRLAIEEAVRSRAAWSGTLRTNPDLGPVRYLYASGVEHLNDQGDVVAMTGTLQDVTERHHADEKLRVAARVFDHMQDAIVVTNTDGMIAAVNDAFERITGYREEEVFGQHPRLLRSERHDEAFYNAIWHALETTGEWRGEIWGKRKSGVTYPQWMTISAMHDAQARCTGYLAVITDTSEIKEATSQLAFLSNHDPLTRLPNRRLLSDRLQQAIDTSHPEQPSVAVLILNIDRLQRINDSMGHGAGDDVICKTGARLMARVPHGDTLARPGSDEFVVVLTQFDDIHGVITFSHQLLDTVAEPLQLHEQTLSVTASVGIALYPQDGATASELLKNADAALSHAKQSGPGIMRFFKAEMNAQALH
ncbi:diguanylate cyclase domain-containing protein [Noviherbaspirillum sp. ST9]|uniref:bifunctional diguanylate cyclase/phosphodiesterase n=1 Tax=Noviherbaspirillum sp. ST9 TaxID=3401606 RepID=UPI003B58623F